MNNQEILNKQLIESCKLNDLEKIKILLQNGADIHFDNNSALNWSVAKGNLEIVKYLVEQKTNHKTNYIEAFRTAIFKEKIEILKYFISQGFSVNNKFEIDYFLRYSIENGHFKMIDFLIEKGADFNNKSLIDAIRINNLKSIKYLVQKGLNIYDENNEALRKSIYYEKITVIEYLVDLYLKDNKKEILLKILNENSNIEIKKYFDSKIFAKKLEEQLAPNKKIKKTKI